MKLRPPLQTESVLARRLRVSARWVRAEAEAGRLPHVKADNVLLFDPERVEAVLLQRAQTTPDNESEVAHAE